MSLFIGNLSRDTTEKDIEELFSKYGKCKINFKGSYAFAAFEDQKEAEKAKDELNSEKLNGRQINVEWCRSKPRGERGNDRGRYRDGERERERNSDRERDRDRDNNRESKDYRGKCYVCNKYGHYARDCPDSVPRRKYADKRKSHGFYSRYKRSKSRSSRSGSRSRNYYYSSHKRKSWREEEDKNNRSRSSSRNRSNNRYDNCKKRKDSDTWGEKNSFGSKSRSWSRKRSRSRSKGKNRYRNKYRNNDDRNRSNSREKYYDKKEKSNGGNASLDDWGEENEKVGDVKEK